MKKNIFHFDDEDLQNEIEEWKVLFSSLRITPMTSSLLQHCHQYSYDIYSAAYFMNESIKKTRDFTKTRSEVIQRFFS